MRMARMTILPSAGLRVVSHLGRAVCMLHVRREDVDVGVID